MSQNQPKRRTPRQILFEPQLRVDAIDCASVSPTEGRARSLARNDSDCFTLSRHSHSQKPDQGTREMCGFTS